MPYDRTLRHSSRVDCLVLACLVLLQLCGAAAGQFGGGGGPFGQAPPGDFKNDPKPRRVPHYAPRESKPIVDVKITGRLVVDEAKLRSMIQTRVGRDYDPEQTQRDVRTLIGSGLFQNVRTYSNEVNGGVAVTFEVFERPLIQYVRFSGNRKKKEKALRKQVGIRVGDPLSRFSAEEARRKLEQFYRNAGYSDATVTLVEGTRPTDKGVAFQITEGTRQRIYKTQFEGNTIASDARLKTQVQSKPGILWYFGGNVVPDEVDEDLDRLTSYYRSLGFFRAKVTHRLDWNPDRTWLTVTYIIDEGLRYRIRSIRLEGNQKFATNRLLGKTETRQGEFFNLAGLQRDLTAVRDEYGGSGYIFADVDAEPQFLEEPGWLDLVYKVNEGEQYRVGRILVNIDGDDQHTRRTVVLNRLSIRPGDIINTKELRASERRLLASQLFLHDPAQGIVPSITVKPPDDETQFASQPQPAGRSTARGQSPTPSPAPASPATHTSYRPVVDVEVHVASKSPSDQGGPSR